MLKNNLWDAVLIASHKLQTWVILLIQISSHSPALHH